jgi:hypothetical protein
LTGSPRVCWDIFLPVSFNLQSAQESCPAGEPGWEAVASLAATTTSSWRA